ncbi:MAG: phosphotransferase [Deltaproteobacteria bacterium]|nr:phosphotransferase [Deltaproteobacteria bacterium]
MSSNLNDITDNLRFMVHDVTVQVDQARQFFNSPSHDLAEKVTSRDNYIDTLKGLIQEKVYAHLTSLRPDDKLLIDFLRAVITITGNLERIADFSVNMLRQASHLSDIAFIRGFDYEPFFQEVHSGLEHIRPALDQREIGLAFKICQCEFNLDELYGDNFKRILDGLQNDGPTGNLITTLLILHYLERMGDSLLNIGEAIVFALTGENLKIHQFNALRESLSTSGLEIPLSKVQVDSIWGNRSGCRIGIVNEKAITPSAQPVLFKHGSIKKLRKEKENIEKWDKIRPGLPPRIHGFVEVQNNEGSILLEFLPGYTFEDILLNTETTVIRDALFILEDTLEQVWHANLIAKPVQADFVRQISDRQQSIFTVHPDFLSSPRQIGLLNIPSFEDLLNTVSNLQQELIAPFSVFIHGDFNVNNIIYDANFRRIHFIDLHRSDYADYVQDISVFLVSIYRLPVFEPLIRGTLNHTIVHFFEFAKSFAKTHGDSTFEARLALGLGRSFFTSTRFTLNQKFAKKMYLLSSFLLERLVEHHGRPWEEFAVPFEALIY